MQPNPQVLSHSADAISAVAIIGVFIGWLPGLAAVGALLWYCIQIYESKTVTNWRMARAQRKESQKRVNSLLIQEREIARIAASKKRHSHH